ncbi:MAG: TldD/PmbA family protein [Calditrichaeota bacterium]|nr:TldD/PmbA family protein [Calditrichota bacterium]
MTDPELELGELTRRTIGHAEGLQAETIAMSGESAVTRFAENAVSQNVCRKELSMMIRVLDGKRSARVATNRADADSLAKALATAHNWAQLQRESAEILPLPEPQSVPPISSYEASTAQVSANVRAEAVMKAISACKKEGLRSAGICSSGWSAVAVANTKGLLVSQKSTMANFSLSVQTEDSSGWAEASSRAFEEIDIPALISVAKEKALGSRKAKSIEPGAYTVVLEHAAVADILQFMSWFGFGGLGFVEGRTFMAGRLGEPVLGENITIRDDAFHPLQKGLAFDFEGLPRQSVTLVEKGIAKSVVHDRVTAERAKSRTTGHALPQPSAEGPYPLNLVLLPGESSVEDMVALTERGILVTRFHYTNLVEPMALVLTGMTRDGTFLIEKGKVTTPLKNLRFTQSVVEALREVELISRDLKTEHSDWGLGSYTAPALKIRRFNFSSGTEF